MVDLRMILPRRYITWPAAGALRGGVRARLADSCQPRIPFTFSCNNARVAYAWWWYGYSQHQPDLVSAAKTIVYTCTGDPQQRGVFPVEYDLQHHAWATVADRTMDDLVACCWTARWLVRWYDDLEHDQAVYEYTQAFCDGLIAMQDRTGGFPDVFAQTGHMGASEKRQQVHAAAALFLAEWAQLTGDQRAVTALVRILQLGRAGSLIAQTLADQPDTAYLWGLACFKSYRLTGDRQDLVDGLALADMLNLAFDNAVVDARAATDPLGVPGTLAELGAAAYRLTQDPRYARLAVSAIVHDLPNAVLTADATWLALNGLAGWAMLEANYGDVLLIG